MEPEDDGKYVCRAQHRLGSLRVSVSLFVRSELAGTRGRAPGSLLDGSPADPSLLPTRLPPAAGALVLLGD